MAVKKSRIIGIALLLALANAPVAGTFANSNNNLVQLDLKKSSPNSVNVTLFTSNGYNDNVMVRKKSDNKYVILIPKVQSSGYSASNLSGVRDLVSNVDVKTVNDTNGGYTKVTLITTKPLDIKTSAQKSTPITEEQKEYKTLIAQANAVKNNIGRTEPKQIQKTEVTVNKASTPVAQKSTIAANKELSNSNKGVKKQSTAPKITLTEVNPQSVKENKDRQTKRAQLAELIQEVKQEKIVEQVPEKTLTTTQNTQADISNNTPDLEVKDINEMPKVEKSSILATLKHKAKKAIKPIGITIASLFGLMFVLRILGAIAAATKETQASFVEQLAQNHAETENFKYNNITDNDELSWQEKYQRYLDASAKPVPRANNKGTYTFIKTPAEPVRKLNKKRQELEKMVSQVSKVRPVEIEPEIVESEDDAIQKSIKFKAFDTQRASLDTTSRDKIKSRFKKYENALPLHEQKNVELGSSILHTNPRRLKDANLDVADVDRNRIKYDNSDYIMSSVDEFFSIIDKEQEAERPKQQPQVQTAPQPVAKKIKPTNTPKQQKQTVTKPLTNPITKLRNDSKTSYLNGLIVKSGYNIDNNKGFYIVNLDGKSALIGKVNDEVFVLKRFNSNVTNPIQVRHDNANVYMVKAGDFKSLVEVNNNKMGVLIEL